MAANGLTLDDFAGDEVECLPDCEEAFGLFSYMSNQWCYSMNGITGLNYYVLFHKMDRMKLAADDYDYLEGDIRVMESAALKIINAKTT